MAQPRTEDRQKIEAMKVAFITEQLSLTPAEAEKFWPVYNQFSDNMRSMRKDRQKIVSGPLNEGDDISSKQSEVTLSNYVTHIKSVQSAELKLIEDLKSILPASKIIKLRLAEDGFKRRMMDRLKGSTEEVVMNKKKGYKISALFYFKSVNYSNFGTDATT